MRVLFASPEVFPYTETGRLSEICASLPSALRAMGHDVRIIMPLYRSVRLIDIELTPIIYRMMVPLGPFHLECQVFQAQMEGGVPIYFVGFDEFFDREDLYRTEEGDYPDNAARFIFFSRAVIEGIKRIDFRPHIFHCHDWQTALIPVYLRSIYRRDPLFRWSSTVLSIHDIASQGIFWHYDMELLGLGWEYFTVDTLEYYGKVNFLKGGIVFSDCITTPSPSYAQDVLTCEHGHGLEGVLATRVDQLHGILNGIDTNEWSPGLDTNIYRVYSADDMSGKEKNKRALVKEAGLVYRKKTPIISFLTRFDQTSGVDLITEVFEKLIERDIQFLVVGGGDQAYNDFLTRMKQKYHDKLAVFLVQNTQLTHRVIAGSDFLLMPSRSGSDGKTQMQALRYGTVPIVRAIGALKDSVIPISLKMARGTGFCFSDYRGDALLKAVDRAIKLFQDEARMGSIQKQAMTADVSWERTASCYSDLYKTLGKVTHH